jgi:hypothetical protein
VCISKTVTCPGGSVACRPAHVKQFSRELPNKDTSWSSKLGVGAWG